MPDKDKKGMVMVISVGGKPPKSPEDTSKPDVKKAPITENTGIGSKNLTPTMLTGEEGGRTGRPTKPIDPMWRTVVGGASNTDEAIDDAGRAEFSSHQALDEEVRDAAREALRNFINREGDFANDTEQFHRDHGWTDEQLDDTVDDMLQTGGESMANNPHIHGLPELFSHHYKPPPLSRTSLSDPSQYGILRDLDKRVGTQMDEERQEALDSGNIDFLESRGNTRAPPTREPRAFDEGQGIMAPSTVSQTKTGGPLTNPFKIQTSFDTIPFDAAWSLLKENDPFRMKRHEMQGEVDAMRDEKVRRGLNTFNQPGGEGEDFGLPKIEGDNEAYPKQQFRMTQPEMNTRLGALQEEIARRGRRPLDE